MLVIKIFYYCYLLNKCFWDYYCAEQLSDDIKDLPSNLLASSIGFICLNAIVFIFWLKSAIMLSLINYIMCYMQDSCSSSH